MTELRIGVACGTQDGAQQPLEHAEQTCARMEKRQQCPRAADALVRDSMATVRLLARSRRPIM